MSEYTLISNEVLKFLHGEGPLEGRHNLSRQRAGER
jgi:hypothetical protein